MGHIVQSLFGGGQAPSVEKAPPTPDSGADLAAQQAAADDERRRASATGRASTILTSALGDVSDPTIARKVLLGDG